MQRRTLALVAVMVLSVAVVGVGGAAAATTDSVQDTSQLQQTNATNASDDRTAEASRPTSQRAGEPPYPVDVPPNQLKNETITSSEVPDVAAAGGSYNMQATRKAAGDPKRAGDPVYEPRGPVRQWPSSDYAGRSGPNNNSSVYFKDYRLRVVGPNIEIWVAQDLSFPGDDRSEENTSISISENQLLYLADEFSNNIYPKETELWRKPVPQNGSDSPYAGPTNETPLPEGYYQSADNKNRTVLLVDNIRDRNYYNKSYPTYVAGLFSPTIGQITDRNAILVDASDWDERLGTPSDPWRERGSTEKYGIEGTLAHEYQHLLHSYADPDETSWINEGLSDLTEKLVGYGVPNGHINTYENYPSNSLIEWEDQVDTVGPITGLADYGAAALFQMYGRQQFGGEFTQTVFSSDANGIESVRNALNESDADRNFYETYQDFSAALLSDGRNTSDRYQIEDVDLDMRTSERAPYASRNVTAAYGNTYNPLGGGDAPTSLNASGIAFRGTPWTTVSNPPSEPSDAALYSTSGNNLDNNAIFSVNPDSSSTLSFDTYYDIERGYDYGFVQISTDGGETWTSLSNENTTDFRNPGYIDPKVQKNLPGFTGDTNGSWVTEEFDLSEYADDGEVLVSFRYITDPASQNPGWFVDDVSVSGTDVSYDGSSTDPFQSLREARENPFRYQFSVLGLGEDGTTEVKQYGPKTFENNGSTSLSSLPEGEFNQTIFTATWAPEMTATGTVPYGYEVNPQAGEPPEDGGDGAENTLTIVGQGDRSEYTFSVTDDLSKSTANDANINTADDIRRGYVADGEVGISADSYTFSGTLETIKVSGDAEVYLNGERVSDDKIDAMRDNVIEIAGTGSAAQYDFASTVDADTPLQKVTANNANLNGGDKVFRTTANGEVGISKDAYGFNGVIDSLEVNGDANVYVNGKQVDPANEQDNMITIVGTGDAASYEFTTSSTALAPSAANYANINANDEINGDTKTGEVGISADSNDYSGDITSFSSSGADIQVYVDGEQIDEGNVANEA